MGLRGTKSTVRMEEGKKKTERGWGLEWNDLNLPSPLYGGGEIGKVI